MRRFTFLLALVIFAACRPTDSQPQSQGDEQLQKPGMQQGADVPALDAPAKGLRVEFPTATGSASGYLSGPPVAAGKHPAIIVIQEWWGLDDWIKANTDRFAGEGFVALAVDLYRGRVTTDPAEAHELMRGLPQDRAMADLKGAFNYLASRPDVDPARIGAIGWCMGGGYALQLASAEPRLKAAVVNYGHVITDPAAIRNIGATLQGNFGAQDRGIPEADVRAFQQALTSAGKQFDLKVYPGVGHAFMNPNNKEGYNAEASEDAWERIDQFFKTNL